MRPDRATPAVDFPNIDLRSRIRVDLGKIDGENWQVPVGIDTLGCGHDSPITIVFPGDQSKGSRYGRCAAYSTLKNRGGGSGQV